MDSQIYTHSSDLPILFSEIDGLVCGIHGIPFIFLSINAVEVKVEVMKGVSWEERITEQVTRTEEKRSIIEKHIEQLQPQKKHPAVVCDIDDDWFMLLDPVLLQERSVPSGTKKTSKHIHTYTKMHAITQK